MKRFCGLLLMGLLTGCKQASRGSLPDKVPLTQEECARLHDLVFPLEVEPYKRSLVGSEVIVSFTASLSNDQIISFYQTNMVQAGWKLGGVVRTSESCLVFVKPSKYCTIVVRSVGQDVEVTLFVVPKKGG